MNRIQGLRRQDGTVCASEGKDKSEVQEFYQNLYESEGFSDATELLNHVPVKVSLDMNADLTKPYTAAKVRTTFFQMGPSKAPGVDGFTVSFYQRHWSLVGNDVTRTVLDFLNGGELPSYLNDTSITLIPKVRHPPSISQY